MLVCPMCRNDVIILKENCHVIPRAFVKTTKINGRNIEINLKDSGISINQKDEAGDYWCQSCETESGILDGYGASVLLHRTQGTLNRQQVIKVVFQVLKDLDYLKFKQFIISIAIRDYLNKKYKKERTLFSKEIFRKLKKEYYGKTDEMLIVGHYLPDNDPMAKTISSLVSTRSKDGINFQLLNFALQLYFSSRQDVKNVSLTKDGTLTMLEIGYEELGTYEILDKEYLKIINDKKNNTSVERIRKKYDAN